MVAAAITPRRRGTLPNELKLVLPNDGLAPAASAKMRRSLGYAQTALFGKCGRTMFQPITERQYARIGGPRWALSPELRETLPWRISVFDNAPPLAVGSAAFDPIVVYANASGSGRLACVTILDGVRASAHAHFPSWMKALPPGIYEFELREGIFGITIASEIAPGRQALLCCDNIGVNGAIIRGASRARLGRILRAVFWAFAAARGIRVWVEYAKSALDAIDFPPRTCGILAIENRMGDTHPNEGIPRTLAKFPRSKADLYAAQYGAPVTSSGRVPPFPCIPVCARRTSDQ